MSRIWASRIICRTKSSWIKPSTETSQITRPLVDVEKTFINKNVQSLLYKLTGLDIHGKVFRSRNMKNLQRSHYALMTKKMFDNAIEKMEKRGRKFLQFVPVKEARPEEFTVLDRDENIAGFDQSNFVFTDITFDATNRNRIVVVREPNGTLRTALPEEHDRMNRVYYEQPDRPVHPPNVFRDPYLQNALDSYKHEFLMDWACYFFEPDDGEFVKLSCKIFDNVVATKKFDLLRSTRHFGPLIYYLVLNSQLTPLLKYFASTGSVTDVANLIRLQQHVYPDWRTATVENDSDKNVVEIYLKQNRRQVDRIPELAQILKNIKSFNVVNIES